MPTNLNAYDTGKAKLASGDYEAAITGFTDLIRSTSDKSLEGKSKILLSSAYLRRNGPGDEAQAMRLYKDVVSDYEVPPNVRALAINSIAWNVKRHDISLYQLYFPEDPYNSYIPTTGNDAVKVQEVYLKLLQLSDTTFPNSYAEYLIAGSYYAPLIGQLIAKGATPKDPALHAAALEAQKYVQKGDGTLDTEMYLHGLLVEAYLNRATGIMSSEGVLDTMPAAQREEAFKKVLEYASSLSAQEQTNPTVASNVLTARFFYADFLLRTGESSRNSDIRAILEPFGTVTTPGLISSSAYVIMRSKELTKISPELKTYLDSDGLKP